jgi:hypothetical protein
MYYQLLDLILTFGVLHIIAGALLHLYYTRKVAKPFYIEIAELDDYLKNTRYSGISIGIAFGGLIMLIISIGLRI